MSFKKYPKYKFTNKKLYDDVKDAIEKEQPKKNKSDTDDKVNEVLNKAGFFHSKNKGRG